MIRTDGKPTIAWAEPSSFQIGPGPKAYQAPLPPPRDDRRNLGLVELAQKVEGITPDHDGWLEDFDVALNELLDRAVELSGR